MRRFVTQVRRTCDIQTSELKPLDDWTGTPLAQLTRAQMAERHKLMSGKNGPRAANKAMKNVRAAWNLARGRHPECPPTSSPATSTPVAFLLEKTGVAKKDQPKRDAGRDARGRGTARR